MKNKKNVTRRVMLLTVVTCFLFSGQTGIQVTIGKSNSPSQISGRVPARAAYNVRISGTTFFGNTTFPSAQTAYSPVQEFELDGTLVVGPAQESSGVNFNNGINARDVGIFIGRPSANPTAGAVQFATNSAVFRDAGKGNVQQKSAALDVAFVTTNEQGVLKVRVDDKAARTVQLNTFNVRSGLLANVYQILAGSMELKFYDVGQEVRGTLDFVGSGLIQPSSARVRATITGRTGSNSSAPDNPPSSGKMTPSLQLVGAWRANVSEAGNNIEINYTFGADGTTDIFLRDAQGRTVRDHGTWQYSNGVLYERFSNGRGGQGSIKWLDRNTFELTIIDNGNPAYRGLKRRYHRIR